MLIGHVYAWSEYDGNLCLELDGENDYIGFAGLPLKQFTIELWMKPNITIEAGSNLKYGHERGYLISIGDGIQGWFNYTDGNFVVRLSLELPGYMNTKFPEYKGAIQVWNASLWYHIAIVYDDLTVRCYVNATNVMSQEIPTEPFVGRYSIRYAYYDGKIGTSINDSNLAFKGSIDEIRYWNVSRLSTEITQTYNRPLNDTEMNSPNLIGYWKLDDNATSCRDYSLRQANATLGPYPYAPSWQIVPEFASFLILPLFMMATLLAVVFYKRKLSTDSIVDLRNASDK
jgi:hypothetical protein